jgi:hypothetical protein
MLKLNDKIAEMTLSQKFSLILLRSKSITSANFDKFGRRYFPLLSEYMYAIFILEHKPT